MVVPGSPWFNFLAALVNGQLIASGQLGFLKLFCSMLEDILYLYISSCHKAHKALTFSFHPLRFAAKAPTVVHDCHPATRLSSSTILLHVVFGRAGLLLPSDLHSNAVTQCFSLFFLNICPIHFHLRRLISSLVLFTLLWSPGFVGARCPWPSYSQYAFHAFVLESVQLLCFCFRELPSFAAIHQNCSARTILAIRNSKNPRVNIDTYITRFCANKMSRQFFQPVDKFVWYRVNSFTQPCPIFH